MARTKITISPIPHAAFGMFRKHGVESGEAFHCGTKYYLDPSKGTLTIFAEQGRELVLILNLIPADDVDQFEIHQDVPAIEEFRKKLTKTSN